MREGDAVLEAYEADQRRRRATAQADSKRSFILVPNAPLEL
jgi:hypothetical protein